MNSVICFELQIEKNNNLSYNVINHSYKPIKCNNVIKKHEVKIVNTVFT